MENNFKRNAAKKRKANKIVVKLLSVVLLAGAIYAGLYASGVISNTSSAKLETEQLLKKANNVTDEATLRELLAMDCELDICVAEDIEITETLVVNGDKKVTSDKVLKANFKMKDASAMLAVSKRANLSIDGWDLDGNGLALGVYVERHASLTHVSGKMQYMGTYGVVSEGITNLSEETEISHVGEGAVKVVLEGEMNISGGKYMDGGVYLANIENGGIFNVSGDALFDGAGEYLVYNKGEATINGGTFLNSGYRGVVNFAKMTMEYEGSQKDGFIEVGHTANVAIYTSAAFKVTYKNVYGHDAGANVFLQAHTGSRCYVDDCVFDTASGNVVSLRGESHITNVEVRNAGVAGFIIQQNGVATLKNINIDVTTGRGIDVQAATLYGENINISNTEGVGIGVQTYEEIGPAKAEISNIHLKGIRGNSLKVSNGASLAVKDSLLEKSKRTSVMVENGTISLNNVEVLGVLDQDVNVVQVAKKGELTISGKTMVTGATMRAVAVYGGKFIMKNGTISNNDASETGAGVHISKEGDSVGTFVMDDGVICNNVTVNEKKNAGGVNVAKDALFIMNGGKIYGNKTSGIGGGVRVAENATFKMTGGNIYQNIAETAGGGVALDSKARFNLEDGSIYLNESKASSGGVYVLGDFTMNGGKIYQNKAAKYGGAMNLVSQTNSKTKEVTAAGTFTMKGGEIYGNSAISGGGAIQVSANTKAYLSGGRVTFNETLGIGDGVRVTGDVVISNEFYIGNDKVALNGENVTVKITGKTLKKHSAKDPLLVSVVDGVKKGHVAVKCDDVESAKSILSYAASGNGSYLFSQKDSNLIVDYACADMDMSGADKVYVTNFQELKQAITNTTNKRYIILGADILMEETITVPNGTTVYVRDDGVKRTLSRKEGVTTAFFNTRYGTGIYLVGTKAGNLVLDGEISNSENSTKIKSLITAKGGTIIDGVNFLNNGSDKSEDLLGCFVYQSYGKVEIYESSFDGAKGNSGAIGLASLATGYVENCSFTNNTALKGGGAIRLEKNSEMTVKKSVFKSNTAGTSGGAIINESGVFIAVDCDFFNNSAINDGGIIKSNNGTAKFLDEDGKINVINENEAGNAGGAIWALGVLQVEGYSFDKNIASTKNAANGGAIAVNGKTTIATVERTTFSNNKSEKNCGGAISNSEATLIIAESEFVSNRSTDANKNGGAIYVKDNESFTTISDSKFIDNQAKDGGAIRIIAGSLEIEESIFDNNMATENGGAICTIPEDEKAVVKVIIKGGSFVENHAINGGAIFNGLYGEMASVVETEQVTFSGNYTTGNAAGAIYVQGTYADVNSNFQSNKACDEEGNLTKNGGAIYLNNEKSKATLKGTSFNGNEAKDGGAIRIVSGLMDVDSCIFESNKTSTGNGGAIYSENKANTENIVTLRVANSTFVDNFAVSAGGAIYSKNGYVEITASDFDANQAAGTSANLGGGAICVTDGEVLIIGKDDLSNKFANNSAVSAGAINITDEANAQIYIENYVFEENNATSGNGGAIRVANQAKISACQFIKNHADKSYGGAIYVTNVSKGSVAADSIQNQFIGNTANEGGAIYYNTGNVLNADSWKFKENRAKTNGGAIFINQGNVNLNGTGDFVGNYAENAGGAIYVASGMLNVSESTLSGIQYNFKENVAVTSHGGAIHVAGGSANIYNSKFEANRSEKNCGGAIRSGVDTLIQSCEFVGNIAGDSQGNVYKNGGAIYFNVQNKTYTVRNSIFDGNKAKDGGAIRITNGALNIYETDFRNNQALDPNLTDSTAEGSGGAIYISSVNTQVSLIGKVDNSNLLENNDAMNLGGAINLADAGAKLNVTNYLFSGNKAMSNGSAICVSAAELAVTDCDFLNNKAGTAVENVDKLNGNAAIYVTGKATATLSASIENKYKFSNNTAERASGEKQTFGSLYANQGTITFNQNYVFELNNTELTQTAGLGKGIGKNTNGVLLEVAEASDYASLNATIKNASSTCPTEITLKGNVVIGNERIDVHDGKEIVIQNAKEDNIEISRTSSSANNMFYIYSGGKLTLKSNPEGNTLIVNGNDVQKEAMLYGKGDLNLDAVAIVNGKADTGSAVKMQGSSATLRMNSCVVSGNESTGNGGAIVLLDSSDAEISNTTFQDNIATGNSSYGGAICLEGGILNLKGTGSFEKNNAAYAGGAIYIVSGMLNVSEPTISGIQYNFKENVTVTNHGGAIHVAGGSANIYNSKFEANRSEKNCGGAIRSGVDTLIQSCEFVGNIAGDSQGNVYANGGAIYFNIQNKTYTVRNSIFDGNKAKDGGAIRITNGTLNIYETDFRNNQALDRNSQTKGYGGALNASDNAYCVLEGNNTTKNVFENNHTNQSGGAIVASNKKLTIKNYKFIGNTAAVSGKCYHGNTAKNAVIENVEGWTND